jgi:nitroreductase
MPIVESDAGRIILDALRSRRSTPLVSPDPPPLAVVEQIIQAGVWAPNHHKTEPWRFIVVGGTARERLGTLMAQCLAERLSETESDEAHRRLSKERAKPMRAPIIIAVAAVPAEEPGVVEIEEVEAVAAAVQNMLLAAEAVGLCAMWRTGKAAYDARVKNFLGIPARAHLVAFVYLGFPVAPGQRVRTREASRYITWLGEVDRGGAV